MVAAWNVDADRVRTILRSAGSAYDAVSEQLYGSAATGGTAGVGSWDSRCADIADAGGADGIVSGAFDSYASDLLDGVGDALDEFGRVMDATFQAAQALVDGDEAMAQAIGAAHGAAADTEGGVW